jgi:hypothetical protein
MALSSRPHIQCIDQLQGLQMNTDLKQFVVSYLRVVLMALMPLAVTAFLTMPYILGGHPGEPLSRADRTEPHMT